jgi:hypothetical protein
MTWHHTPKISKIPKHGNTPYDTGWIYDATIGFYRRIVDDTCIVPEDPILNYRICTYRRDREIFSSSSSDSSMSSLSSVSMSSLSSLSSPSSDSSISSPSSLSSPSSDSSMSSPSSLSSGPSLPATVQANFGSTFLDSTCGASVWTPAIQSLALNMAGTAYDFNDVGDNVIYIDLFWDGSQWVIQANTTASPYATTTSWYQWYGPATPLDPTGTYSGPYTNSTCMGSSSPDAFVFVS